MFSTRRQSIFFTAMSFFLWHGVANAQNLNRFAVDVIGGHVIANSTANQSIINAYPFSIQLRKIQTLQDPIFRSLYKCNLNRGGLLQFTHYNRSILGNAVIAGYFLEPFWYINPNLHIGIRAAGGLAYTSNPYNSEQNPQNFTYSTYINNYTTLGGSIGWMGKGPWSVDAIVQLNHLSNGGLNRPNIGLNWLTAGIGVYYNLPKLAEPKWLPADTSRIHPWAVEMAGYASYPKLDTVRNQQFFIAGLSFQFAKRGLLHGWTMGGEITYDPMYSERGKQRKDLELAPWLAGALVGHEFILGKFLFSQQLGIYLQQTHLIYKSPIYHRWGITYSVSRRIALGINIKAHNETANFMDARLVYRIK